MSNKNLWREKPVKSFAINLAKSRKRHAMFETTLVASKNDITKPQEISRGTGISRIDYFVHHLVAPISNVLLSFGLT